LTWYSLFCSVRVSRETLTRVFYYPTAWWQPVIFPLWQVLLRQQTILLTLPRFIVSTALKHQCAFFLQP
jgi:hypothetical protein